MSGLVTFTRGRLIGLLAPALGDERSELLVEQTLASLGLQPPLSTEQTEHFLATLGRQGGTVGAAARLAAQRLHTPTHSLPPLGPVPSPAASPPPGPLAASSTSAWIDLVALLAPTLGSERATSAVAQARQRLGLPGSRLDRASALSVLDHLGAEAGLVGVTARFVKTRLLLSA